MEYLPCFFCITALEYPLEFLHYPSFVPSFFFMSDHEVFQTSHRYFWRPEFLMSCLLSLAMVRKRESLLPTQFYIILIPCDFDVVFALCLASLSLSVQDLLSKRTSGVNIAPNVSGKSVKF